MKKRFTVLTSALIGDTCDDYTWFLDTGASEHLELFSFYHTLNIDRLIKFGDGRVLKAEDIGSVRLLSDTLIGSALNKGYTMVSNNHVSKILNSKGKISAIAERAGSLYKM
ncbi:hypothetical protein PR048_031473 [Dryococelus australis]|uniref:Uncharacterized protein n=1 Tax=Dryococelus australis TaxID=614101 RepID=A0ABQ9G5D2_9NEOP|nr:hypothetical protein PR048_031473 [Dryococelus australis]